MSYFQHDVLRVAEHPEVERSRLELVQPSIPRDRHMIGPTNLAGLQIILEIFIGWRKQEIVIDSDHSSAGCCLLDQLGALLGSDRHRLFQQDMQAPLDQGRCRAGMEVGRQENVSCVESEFPVFEHRIQRLVRSGDTIYGCPNAWARDRSLSKTATNETPGSCSVPWRASRRYKPVPKSPTRSGWTAFFIPKILDLSQTMNSHSVIQPAAGSPLGTEPRCSITRLRLPESLPSQYRKKPTACGNLAKTIHIAYILASGSDQPRWTV